MSEAALPASGIGRKRVPSAKRNFSVLALGRSLGMPMPLMALPLILILTSGLRTFGRFLYDSQSRKLPAGEDSFER